MLPLSEIRAVHLSVDGEWRSPVADAVAARWGIAPGVARFWRSSASHVFVVPSGADPRGVLYLRFVPAALRPRSSVEVPAELLAALGGDGCVVGPVPSLAGGLAETVPTPHGDVHAVVVPQAPGTELDTDEITTAQAAAWGTALARFHLAAAPHTGLVDSITHLPSPGIPGPRNGGDPFAVLARIAVDTADAALSEATGRLAASWDRIVDRLPGGVLHGDFELDNLRFEGTNVVAFDADETSIGPYVLDIASATRDLIGDDGTLDAPRHPAVLAAFLDGYESTRPLGDDEHAALTLGLAQVAARSLVHGHGVLDAGDTPHDPAWLIDLRAHLADYHARTRDTLLATAI